MPNLISISLLSFFLIATTTTTSISGAPTYLTTYCPNTTLFTANSSYEKNLNILLTSHSSKGTYINGFATTSIGANSNSTVYGLFFCRGDNNIAICSECIQAAAKALPKNCPRGKTAITWYDECLIGYSNESFVGHLDDSRALILRNTGNVTNNATGFNQVLAAMLNKLTMVAANSDFKFATEQAEFTTLQSVYALGQCTPDLSTSDCSSCLTECVAKFPSCCFTSQGARVVFPSCNLRYEIYPFYKMTAVETPPASPPGFTFAAVGGRRRKTTAKIIIAAGAGGAAVLMMLLTTGICMRRRKQRRDELKAQHADFGFITAESLQFDFGTLQRATDNFSNHNKIGQGGFGAVYKGTLADGQEIAVKRLSRRSDQVTEEFKNEVVLVANLQHRNLVRLLGFCMSRDESLLVFEYVPNKSLDYFLFDTENQGLLNWQIRCQIIAGIARGMLYLHEDSRLTIIHRDLKAGNILLDKDLKPKIADFGMARLLGVDQFQKKSGKIAGTLGYMAPEYRLRGEYSTKSDVYSYGILVLEIISGKKNRSFKVSDLAQDLVNYTWGLWSRGTPLEMMDPTLKDSYSSHEVYRCIQIGLLCVQELADERPTMSSIAYMLNMLSIDSDTLPVPGKPAFLAGSSADEGMACAGTGSDQSRSRLVPLSVNEMTVTEFNPR